ncbi:transient receptor potential cation channel subfamily A member 1-like [Ambystoma mexicanum]|uniref:transient receptor potential cation channel subfamily A member 1-like n=1 Tax=Ambystoma mexicanum TaxID=8296 RepID=UPI0037E7D29E
MPSYAYICRQLNGDVINLKTLNHLLERGSNINATDLYGQTVMHEVAKGWDPEVAKYLIVRGAEVNKADRFGVTPLHVAAAVDYPEMIAILLQFGGANINATSAYGKQTPIHYAAKYDAVESLKMLLRNNADLGAKDYKGRTALQLAAELDRSESARLLLSIKSDASVRDASGSFCLTMLIVTMPPIAFIALDQFHVRDRANRKQYFYINLIEPENTEFKDSRAKSPLEVIVQSRQFDIIMHPVIQKLIELKWQRFGKRNIAFMLASNLIFIFSWTCLGIAASLDREESSYQFPEDIWRLILLMAAVGLTIYQLVEEFREIYNSQKKFKLWKGWWKQELEKDLALCHPRWPEEKEYLQKRILDLKQSRLAYLKDLWNWFDWIVYLMLLVVFVTHILDLCLEYNKDLHTAHLRLFSITIIMLWLGLLKHARAIRVLGPFIVMLENIMTDILKFMFLYGEFYIPYACAFWMIFGGHVPNMNTIHQMMFTVFRITLVDDYGFDAMYQRDHLMAYLLCVSFLAISSILCINLLIALLSDAFQRVYDNATANASMQQASRMLQMEEHLNKSNRDDYRRHIRESCSPLTLFYDDDLSINQDEALKKITTQIKVVEGPAESRCWKRVQMGSEGFTMTQIHKDGLAKSDERQLSEDLPVVSGRIRKDAG